jgi:osmotically-inducible protein OsmY
MKSRIPHALAALVVAAAAGAAHSQVAPPANLVDEPVASVSRSDDLANAIAQALNAEASLKQTKITVQPDEAGVILLTGSATTEAQRLRATQIAVSQAGEGKVVNTIATDENVIWVPSSVQPSAQPPES